MGSGGGRCDADTNTCVPPPADGAEGDSETAPESDAALEAEPIVKRIRATAG